MQTLLMSGAQLPRENQETGLPSLNGRCTRGQVNLRREGHETNRAPTHPALYRKLSHNPLSEVTISKPADTGEHRKWILVVAGLVLVTT